MKTRLPVSTISFNTEPYLRLKLEELRKARILSEWYFIRHKGEDDEAGKRDHFHVHMVPAKGIQTDDIREALVEFDPENPERPRKCLSVKYSRFGNWFLYAIHDPDYLASKNESRKFHYKKEQVIASDPDILNEHYREIDITAELGAFKGMKQAQDDGLTFEQYFAQGKVPVAQISAYMKAWGVMKSGSTFRGEHNAHVIQDEFGNMLDPETGEYLG